MAGAALAWQSGRSPGEQSDDQTRNSPVGSTPRKAPRCEEAVGCPAATGLCDVAAGRSFGGYFKSIGGITVSWGSISTVRSVVSFEAYLAGRSFGLVPIEPPEITIS